jgi:hypothetical protein
MRAGQEFAKLEKHHSHGSSDTWITSFAPSPPTDLMA